jgi:hypothetical protein
MWSIADKKDQWNQTLTANMASLDTPATVAAGPAATPAVATTAVTAPSFGLVFFIDLLPFFLLLLL